jgi:hypothetical protein
MEKRKLIAGVALLMLYFSSYCALRLTKYFVRQEFVTFGCPDRIREKYADDPGPNKDGHISYSFDSERNQIGCGRIQKIEKRFAEVIMLPVFRPVGELEMYIRGFNSPILYVHKIVSEFERYDSDANKVYFPRAVLTEKFPVRRKDQTF